MSHFNNKRFYCEVTPPNQGKEEPVVKMPFLQKNLSLLKKFYTIQIVDPDDLLYLTLKFTILGCLIGCFYGYSDAKSKIKKFPSFYGNTYMQRRQVYTGLMLVNGLIYSGIGLLWPITLPYYMVVKPISLICAR
jgi:hypothetical protein